MNIYVMRHGATCWNEKGITQGRTNNRLSKSGIELTKKVAKEYKNDKIDMIFCSPLMRTMQTANLMNAYHNVKIIKDERLIEIDQGIFSGKKYNDLTDEQKLLKNSRSKQCGMESYGQVFERTRNFFEELKTKYTQKNVLIITHKCVASILEILACGQKFDENSKKIMTSFNNSQVKLFNL